MPDFPIKGTIIDLVERRAFVNFWSFDPPTEAVQAAYAYQEVQGRFAPYRFYTSTGADHWEWVIHLRGSIEQGDTRTNAEVWKDHLFIKSLQYPDYGTRKRGPVKPPHKVLMTWGLGVRLQGVILQPRFTWIPPYDENGYPYGIDVSFTFEADQETGTFDYSDVRAQAGMVGLGMEIGRSG